MNNEITARNPTTAASNRPLPASLKRAIADSFALDHPDLPWQLPDILPPVSDIATGITILEAQTAPVDAKHATFCVSKLAVAFNLRLAGDEAKLLAAVWLEANGDLPNDLWSAGTVELMRTYKFGMPKPPHLRELVIARMDERTTKLLRARQMLAKIGEGARSKPVARESKTERLRGMRNSFRRVGNLWKAANYERELAHEIGREPHDWAMQDFAEPIPGGREGAPSAPPLGPRMQARTTAAAARFHRSAGRIVYAEQLEREVGALGFKTPVQDERPAVDDMRTIAAREWEHRSADERVADLARAGRADDDQMEAVA